MLTLRKRRVAKQADVWSGGKFGKGGGGFPGIQKSPFIGLGLCVLANCTSRMRKSFVWTWLTSFARRKRIRNFKEASPSP